MTSLHNSRLERNADYIRALRGQWWSHLLIATILTFALNGDDEPWARWFIVFGANLLLSVCIGMATTAIYVYGWGTTLIEGGPLRRAAAHGISVIVGVLIGVELALGLLHLTLLADVRVTINREDIWRVAVVITAIVMMGSVTYDRLLERIRTVELREQKAQQALLRAQIDNLQAKVNPHFLFNALNTVATLAEEDSEAAVEAVERLSALLRYSLEGAERGQVSLRRELDAVRSYLALEELRFGERLSSRVDVDDGVESVDVPPFLIQPLVENAVKHGIAARREGGKVWVQVTAEGDNLRFQVRDDGPGHSQSPGTKVGHANVAKRLKLLYGKAARFSAGPGIDGGYRVELVVPRTHPAQSRAS
ncbi:MAG: histidine kinase [Myxococcota bacterium]